MTRLLDIVDVGKTFTLHILGSMQIHVLKGISFSLDEGEAIGLTGSSGSGKSTLMKCIHRTYLATGGQIIYHSAEFGQVDLVDCPDQLVLQLRRQEMTYCSQFLRVIPRVDAVEVVGNRLVEQGTDRGEATARARDHLERLNLPRELWNAYPATFSGGEQQRINIAQAVIARPRFLLVDEPTASLDSRTKDVVIDIILELKSEGTAVICITHDAHTLDRLSDRVYSLETTAYVPPPRLAQRN